MSRPVSSRPWTVVVLVVALAGDAVYSMAVQPDVFSLWNLLFTLFFLSLLKALWDGERGMWWLFVILAGVATGGGLVVALDETPALAAAVAGAATLGLLLARPTRAWFSVGSAEAARGATG